MSSVPEAIVDRQLNMRVLAAIAKRPLRREEVLEVGSYTSESPTRLLDRALPGIAH